MVVVLPLALIYGVPFVNELRLRRAAPKLCEVPSTRVDGQPYLKGRVAIVNEDERGKHWDVLLGTYMPEDVAAHAPSEVTTCVVVDWSWRVGGRYNVTKVAPDGTETPDGVAAAKEQTAHVTVIDLTIPAVVGEADFAGGVPEGVQTDSRDERDPTLGYKPIEPVEKWLYALPRR